MHKFNHSSLGSEKIVAIKIIKGCKCVPKWVAVHKFYQCTALLYKKRLLLKKAKFHSGGEDVNSTLPKFHKQCYLENLPDLQTFKECFLKNSCELSSNEILVKNLGKRFFRIEMSKKLSKGWHLIIVIIAVYVFAEVNYFLIST